MRAVVQRVSEAAVHIDGESVGSIGRGYLVLLGVIPVIALAVVTDALFSLVTTLIKGEAGD